MAMSLYIEEENCDENFYCDISECSIDAEESLDLPVSGQICKNLLIW